MAIAFGRVGHFSGTTSPITATVTINAGETAVVAVILDPATLTVTGISGGGTYTLRDTQTNGGIKTEVYSTDAGAATAATTVQVSISGTITDAGMFAAAYTGVLGIGATNKATGAAANASISLTTQDNNNFVVSAFGWIGGTGATAGTGNLRDVDSNVAIDDALVDNTSASPGSVTTSATHSANTWAAVALELRSVAGIKPVGYGGTRGAPGVGPRDKRGFLAARKWATDIFTGIIAVGVAAVSTWIANDATVQLGGVTASPSAAVSTWVANDATVVLGGVTATPNAAVATWVANDASVSLGNVTASPSAAVATWVVPNATTTQGGVTASPLAAVATWTANNATVALGGVTASPSAATATWVARDATVALGNVTANPTAAVATWVANDATFGTSGDVAHPAAAVFTWVANDATTQVGDVTVSPAPAVATWVVNDAVFAEQKQAIGGGSFHGPYREIGHPQVAVASAAVSTWVVNDATVSLHATVIAEAAVATWVVNDAKVQRGMSPYEAMLLFLLDDS